MKLRTNRLLLIVLALSLIAAACSGDDDGESANDDSVDAADEPADEPEPEEEPEPEPEPDEDPEPEPEEEPEPEPEGPQFDFAAVDDTVAAYVDAQGLNGAGLIVVHRDHGVIHHQHWGVFDEDRVSLIASSSKMVTAGVLLHLQDDGLLDIDAPIAEYVDWASGHPEVTVAQLLSNSSGLPGLFDTNPYFCMWISSGDLQSCAADIMTTPTDETDVVPPDTVFRYGGAQWQVAGGVAEAVSGKSWHELIDEIYVQPCGLEVFGYGSPFDQIETDGLNYPPGFDNNPDALAASTNPNMEGGAFTNTADYGKLLLMHLQGGMCGDTQVLTPESLALMHRDRIDEVYDGDAFGIYGYGLGWWVDRGNGHLSTEGAYGSDPYLDLEDGYGVLVLTESTSAIGGALADEIREQVDTAIADGVA